MLAKFKVMVLGLVFAGVVVFSSGMVFLFVNMLASTVAYLTVGYIIQVDGIRFWILNVAISVLTLWLVTTLMSRVVRVKLNPSDRKTFFLSVVIFFTTYLLMSGFDLFQHLNGDYRKVTLLGLALELLVFIGIMYREFIRVAIETQLAGISQTGEVTQDKLDKSALRITRYILYGLSVWLAIATLGSLSFFMFSEPGMTAGRIFLHTTLFGFMSVLLFKLAKQL